MVGHQSHAQGTAEQDHERFLSVAKTLFNQLRMSGEMIVFTLNGVLVDGSRDQHVYLAFAQILQRTLQGGDGSAASLLSGLAEIDFQLRLAEAVHQVQLAVAGFSCGRHDVEVCLHSTTVAMVDSSLGRTIHHGRA